MQNKTGLRSCNNNTWRLDGPNDEGLLGGLADADDYLAASGKRRLIGNGRPSEGVRRRPHG